MIQLYAYWRSSASYRVRCALNLKGLPYEIVPVHIVRDGGEQHGGTYGALNPQRLVPTLVDGDLVLGQSLAIFQHLEAIRPEPPLVPDDAPTRLAMWSFCHHVASEIQPLQNTRVLAYLGKTLGIGDEARAAWLRHWIGTGLAALEAMLAQRAELPYCYAAEPTYADCCLVPQLYAAERFGVDLSVLPRLVEINARLCTLPAIVAAHPDRQPDAVVD